MHVLVGRIQRNILSTTLLCQSRWYFSQTPDSFSLKHKDGATMMEVSYFLDAHGYVCIHGRVWTRTGWTTNLLFLV